MNGKVYIIGAGATKIGEHWDKSLRDLAVEALFAAVKDASIDKRDVEALYVSNMMSGELQGQEHLGALIATWAGIPGVAACKVEGACACGGVAIHQAYLAVASGLYDCVAVVGVEKMTDVIPSDVTAALATAEDQDYVVFTGTSFVGLNALIYRFYLEKYRVKQEDIARFAVHCHKMAVSNPYAQFRRPVSLEDVMSSPVIADPIRLLECAPVGDGAAALILCNERFLKENPRDDLIEISGTAVATDIVSMHERRDPLAASALRRALDIAMEKAGIETKEIDVLEVHDAFTILGILPLELMGYAPPGEGWRLVAEGQVEPGGKIPTNTMGGLKARGHPVGGTGVYQVLDIVTQLRGKAGSNQVEDAEIGLAQNFGGVASTVAVNILKRVR
ncbi:MAG: thiolase domain-containing protein [Thermofilaceae archaeon]|nr:thiolase domain-containing protein [Thermofilaceae archaeon]MCX8181298.1 thiolase domain-containing protein [Thermofilaceae archaeon]MDW8004641.1 thiolase domain-containing protein [Thermofilaceae archaeon]